MRTKLLLGGVGALVLMLVAPFYVAGVTNTELLAILTEGLSYGFDLTTTAWRDAMCADGVTAFCP